MINELFYHISPSVDPYHNLALEEQLLLNVQPGQCILYLWQNAHTVVIGRNQNAWAECRAQELESSGGNLVRRLSGGGAVYHDLGNLNFTFLVRRADYDVDRQLSVICQAVRAFGLDARKTGRNDITVDGRKFSGNAFYRTGDCCYHHGTLLIHADTEKMSRYLQVSREKLQSKGVASVRSRVVNLQDLNENITVETLCAQLIAAFGVVYGGTPKLLPQDYINQSLLKERTDFFGSWLWRYGTRAELRSSVSKRFPWGSAELRYSVKNGVLSEVELWSDGLEADLLASLPEQLRSCPFHPEALQQRAGQISTENEAQRTIVDDCFGLLISQIE